VTEPESGLDRFDGGVRTNEARRLSMKSALSHNEIEILDRQVATLSYQLSEIAALLESRLGETNELAASARHAQQEFAKFAQRMRRRVALAETIRPDSDSRTA
jgi:hypothetical protein